jgi:hypothetical protein
LCDFAIENLSQETLLRFSNRQWLNRPSDNAFQAREEARDRRNGGSSLPPAAST